MKSFTWKLQKQPPEEFYEKKVLLKSLQISQENTFWPAT